MNKIVTSEHPIPRFQGLRKLSYPRRVLTPANLANRKERRTFLETQSAVGALFREPNPPSSSHTEKSQDWYRKQLAICRNAVKFRRFYSVTASFSPKETPLPERMVLR